MVWVRLTIVFPRSVQIRKGHILPVRVSRNVHL